MRQYSSLCPDSQKRSRLINIITSAISRCNYKNKKDYKYYGGRGIHVHPAWIDDRREFFRYLMTLPGWDDPTLEIDRIDNDGDYAPGNLRFVTRSVNNQNRRRKSGHGAGVTQLKNGHWQAQLSLQGKKFYLGTFENRDDAANVVIAKRKELGLS